MKLASALLAVFVGTLLVGGIAAAAPVEKTDGFVCPVFNSDSVGEHNPNAFQIGSDDYTIAGPDVRVPLHATNGDGTGMPGGPHSSPGDTDYTAIWADIGPQ